MEETLHAVLCPLKATHAAILYELSPAIPTIIQARLNTEMYGQITPLFCIQLIPICI